MLSKLKQFQYSILFSILLILIPLWNIPHTIAGRYISEGLLLIAVFAYKPDWKIFFSANKILLIFFAYLIIQLVFFSTNLQLAFNNFRAEWMHFILFTFIGAGVGLIFRNSESKKILLYLGIAFSVPLYIHLTLSAIKGISLGAIPWGYWGINEIHGDFGYPALEAAALLSTFYLYQAKNRLDKVLAISLICVCIASPFLAGSRGGTGFTIAGVLLIAGLHFLLTSKVKRNLLRKIIRLIIICIAILGIVKFGLVVDPSRWGGIFSRLSIGLQANPMDVYCNDKKPTEQLESTNSLISTPESSKESTNTVSGDALRMIAAKSGYNLILKNPMGINQSKEAYQIAIVQACEGRPKVFIAHAHNGWIDTALAIGIPGALLLLIALIQYGRLGWLALKRSDATSPYGMALFASVFLWALRGLLDSTFRDQMLEMQAFIFAMLLGMILRPSKPYTQQGI